MPEKYLYRQMPTELNAMWMETFGHTFEECFQLAKLNNEIGVLHKGHIRYVLNQAIETKPLVTPGEDG